ncbi:hypothetical protein FSW04_05200 [Baekduia soli]|uniref:RNA polymerase sigma factor 70 region 4 type 2 domain-containing protein n=1 Tax=Baekduia soli TaxID=496014 RepID=A0A5B8U272_9ACTN|nr:sigma factor-like helix-turn-helix DNA-binding protein [Baekduia soli]QEC47040.1 hypothetical protein FSW04_05200 [Baekduia soli]
MFFRTVPVFDVSMTDPLPGTEPIPLEPPSEPIAGDTHTHLVGPLIALAGELGYRAEIRDLPTDGPGGWCDPKHKVIVVAAGPANAQVRTLVHDIAHALGIGYADYRREQAEVLVDCVTYIACSSAALDMGGESIAYVAGWGEDGALDAIRAYADMVDTVARRIEDAIAARPDRRVHRGLTRVGQGLLARDDRASRAGARYDLTVAASRPAPGPAHPGGVMQPSTHNEQPTRRGDEDSLYRRHHRSLQRSVARVVRASPELIEDACQMAWMMLLRNQPERHRIFAWLRRVAINESYRLSALERRTTNLDYAEATASHALVGDAEALDRACEAREALRALAALPERQRRDLTLKVAGYTYKEIAQLTGGSHLHEHRQDDRQGPRARPTRASAAATADQWSDRERGRHPGGQ